MATVTNLKAFLEDHQVAFEIQDHPEAFTAQRTAQATHIPGRDVAKTVVVRTGTKFHLVVVPAIYRVDLERLAEQLHLSNPHLATEEEMRALFPDCEIGAMPPFGNLYGLPTILDKTLAKEPRIAFPAGNHHQSVVIKRDDFERLAQPRVVDVAVHV